MQKAVKIISSLLEISKGNLPLDHATIQIDGEKLGGKFIFTRFYDQESQKTKNKKQ